MNVQDIAMVCHNVNKAYCESIGDHTQLAWEKAPQWQKDSAIMGVQFKLDNPHATPADQHDAWMKDKIDNGWKYGTTKDEGKKTHPDLLPYAQLSELQKTKDHLFVAVVASLAPLLEHVLDT